MSKNSKQRLLLGVISLILSAYPLYILYHAYLMQSSGLALSSSVTGGYSYLTIISFPLLFLGYFLIFQKFSYRPIKLLVLSAIGYSCLAFSLPMFYLASIGTGALWPLLFFGVIVGIFLIALGATLVSISYSKSKKYLTDLAASDGKIALMFKLIFFLIIIISPLLTNQILIKSSSISSVRIIEQELFESPDGSGSIVYIDTDGSGATLNLSNSETRVIYPNLIRKSYGLTGLARQKLLPKVEFVHEANEYKLDQTFLVVKTTGERIQFPMENVNDCTFLADDKYVACFAYARDDLSNGILYFVPIKSIIK